jgi:hypothetical protein
MQLNARAYMTAKQANAAMWTRAGGEGTHLQRDRETTSFVTLGTHRAEAKNEWLHLIKRVLNAFRARCLGIEVLSTSD